jgi:hypothetical protein
MCSFPLSLIERGEKAAGILPVGRGARRAPALAGPVARALERGANSRLHLQQPRSRAAHRSSKALSSFRGFREQPSVGAGKYGRALEPHTM